MWRAKVIQGRQSGVRGFIDPIWNQNDKSWKMNTPDTESLAYDGDAVSGLVMSQELRLTPVRQETTSYRSSTFIRLLLTSISQIHG